MSVSLLAVNNVGTIVIVALTVLLSTIDTVGDAMVLVVGAVEVVVVLGVITPCY